MKQHIKSLPHHPRRVIVISLLIAITIGVFGYIKINKKVITTVVKDNSNIITNRETLSPQNLTLGFLAGGRIKSVSVKVGDTVKKGQVLAELDAGNTVGALTQAKALYATAEANYQKVINGATGPTIDVAKAAVNTAKINFEQITNQQNVLVDNAYRNLLNSSPEAIPKDSDKNYVAPIISGNYNLGKEGVINLHFYNSSSGISFEASGLTNGTGIMNSITSQPIGDSGLFIKSTFTQIETEDWIIEIPNKKASNYLTNYNAYQLALQTKNQAVDGAQAILDQANASLAALVSSARPEDVAVAQAQMNSALGSVQIAEAAYKNTIITAPSDGIVTSIVINPGQIAIPNASAIELKTNNSLN